MRARFDLARAGQFSDLTTDSAPAPTLPLEGLPTIEPAAPAAIVAAAGDDNEASGPDTWHAVIIVEGQRSTDGREIMPGALNTRTLPLPLMYLTTTTWGHDGAQLGGQIVSIDRDPNTGDLLATGTYADTDQGRELQGLVNSQLLRWVSADLEVISYEYVYDGGGDGYCDPCYDAPDAMRVTEGNVMGATVCPFPAFPQCVIGPPDLDLDAARTAGEDAAEELGMVDQPVAPVAVAASGGPLLPPAFWFEDPQLTAPTPPTLCDDGRFYAHAATFDTEHIGLPGRRVKPPHSASSYAYFRTGEIKVVEPTGQTSKVACGQITIGTNHAPQSGPSATARAAAEHYDQTGTAVVDVAAGEDEFGIWIAGAVRPGISEEQERELRAASLSGDWRTIGGNLEFVACLAVNVPGFPIPRTSAGFARNNGEDEQLALVAAGVLVNDPLADRVSREVAAQLAPWAGLLDELRPLAVERLSASIRP